MMCIMKMRANYEYIRQSNRLFLYFFTDLASYFIGKWLVYDERRANLVEVSSDNFEYFLRSIYLLNGHELLLGFAIICLKGPQDVIREISRLDKDYEVSQFQKYTEKAQAETESIYNS